MSNKNKSLPMTFLLSNYISLAWPDIKGRKLSALYREYRTCLYIFLASVFDRRLHILFLMHSFLWGFRRRSRRRPREKTSQSVEEKLLSHERRTARRIKEEEEKRCLFIFVTESQQQREGRRKFLDGNHGIFLHRFSTCDLSFLFVIGLVLHVSLCLIHLKEEEEHE